MTIVTTDYARPELLAESGWLENSGGATRCPRHSDLRRIPLQCSGSGQDRRTARWRRVELHFNSQGTERRKAHDEQSILRLESNQRPSAYKILLAKCG